MYSIYSTNELGQIAAQLVWGSQLTDEFVNGQTIDLLAHSSTDRQSGSSHLRICWRTDNRAAHTCKFVDGQTIGQLTEVLSIVTAHDVAGDSADVAIFKTWKKYLDRTAPDRV